ncbi:MAG: ABC transporter substrate-binding protein [Myxococcota bacterium]|nr:ABC transporter substrate-binding protein [Myxococcota bacterium]
MPRPDRRALVVTLALFVSSAPAFADGASTAQLAATAPSSKGEIPDAARAAVTERVERLHVVLLQVMKSAEAGTGFTGRFDELEPVLIESFDLPFMAEKSVGRYWKKASSEERAELVDTFTRYMIANYAGRFHGYSGQSFETLRVETSARGTLLVRTRLVDPTGDDVNLDYRMRSHEGAWKIVDVYLNGTVSELALRRSEYSSLIQREGFEALLVALNEKIETLANSPADQAS